MKRIITLALFFVLSLSFLSPVFGQEEMSGPGMAMQSCQGDCPMMKKMVNRGYGKMMVQPEELNSLNEENNDKWLQIAEYKLKKKQNHYLAFAVAIAISIAVFGGAIAQGKVAATAMEGIARNPEASSRMFTPMIISLALIESLVIYALVIAFLLQGKM